MNRSKWLFTVASAAIVCLIGGLLTQPVVAADPIFLKIGYGSPWVGYGPLYVAAEQGYFEEEGLDVEIVRFEGEHGPQDEAAKLAAGEVDALMFTIDLSTLYWTPAAPYSIFLVADASAGGDGILIRNDRNISSIEDLKGRTVDLRKDTPSHFMLNYVLKQNGLSEADVTVADMSPEDAAAAVVAGDVDAAVTWNPFLANAAEDPNVEILMTSKETPGLIADAVLMRGEVLESNPEACQRFARAWDKAVAFQESNPDEGAAIMAKGLDYGTADDVKADLAGVVLQGKEGNAQFFGGDGPGTALDTARFAIELWTETGRLTTPVKAEDLIDTRCLEQ